jgi:hypothetical protein
MSGPEAGFYLAIFVQIVFSLWAAWIMWRVSSLVLLRRWLMLLAVTGYALSIGLLYDQTILSDSLFNSAFVLLFGVPALHLLEGRAPRIGTVLLLSILLLLAHSVRGITIYLTVFLFPVWLYWLVTTLTSRLRIALALAGLLVPMLAFNAAVSEWNYKRTGEYFYVTNIPVPIQSMTKAAGRGHNVFDSDTPVDRLAHEMFHQYSYDEVMELSARLFSEYGIKSTDAIKMEMALYFRSWRNHPWAMLENGFNNFHQSIAYNFFNVPDTNDESYSITFGRHLYPGQREIWKRLREGFEAGLLANILITGVGRIGSWLMLCLFAFGIPVMICRLSVKKLPIERPLGVLAAGWLLFWGYVMALVLLHWVTRFLPAVLPWGLIGSLYVMYAICHRQAGMSVRS